MQFTHVNTKANSRFHLVTANKATGIGLFFLLTLLYGIFFIRNFSGPLAEVTPGDTDQWEYMGYYLLENLSFTPLPHLNLVNNQTFFPYGTNHSFQGWAFESNSWYALNYYFFGIGPWLNVYYLLSLLVSSTGTYLLLRTDYGDRRAWLAGLLVSFLNFYALNKYPGHFAYSIIHWMVLSFLTDFLLIRRLVLYQPISLRLVLLKILVLVLCLGLDVGYILGYALSSFTLSLLFSVGLITYRLYRKPAEMSTYLRRTLLAWPTQWRPVESTALVLAALGLTFFYTPLLIEVAHQATAFIFADRFSGGHGWMHPVRLLLPYFPGFNAVTVLLAKQLHDMPEGVGAGSPGWLILGLAAIGFWYTPKAIRWAYVPLIVFFVLHFIYHPIHLPSLQIFPWCRFNRQPSRVTLVYPVIAAIFALYIPRRLPRFVWLPLVIVGIVEVSMVYRYRYAWQPFYYPQTFKPYIERIRQQPGEAILDWPFCVVGGNGVGGVNGLCPLYKRNSMVYSLKRFHGKKTVGQYFGRLHDLQIEPFLRAGWPKLLNHGEFSEFFLLSGKFTSCFTEEEWQFFDRFYELNDFSGINLCIDLLPETCVKAFYARYGQPAAITEIPATGHVAFIPKLARARAKVNSRLGKQIHFPCGCTAKF